MDLLAFLMTQLTHTILRFSIGVKLWFRQRYMDNPRRCSACLCVHSAQHFFSMKVSRLLPSDSKACKARISAHSITLWTSNCTSTVVAYLFHQNRLDLFPPRAVQLLATPFCRGSVRIDLTLPQSNILWRPALLPFFFLSSGHGKRLQLVPTIMSYWLHFS